MNSILIHFIYCIFNTSCTVYTYPSVTLLIAVANEAGESNPRPLARFSREYLFCNRLNIILLNTTVQKICVILLLK